MRLPRLSFTVRCLLLAVAIAALPEWWFVGRPAWFARVASGHYEQYLAETTYHDEQYGSTTEHVSNTTMLGEWHLIMSRRYDRAAEHSFWPMGRDLKPPRPGDVLIYDPQDEYYQRHFGTPEEQRRVLERRR